METVIRWVVARGWQGEGMRSECLLGTRFSFEGIKCSGTGQRRWWLHDIMKALNATELYTLKW